jgi:hypothetical protein
VCAVSVAAGLAGAGGGALGPPARFAQKRGDGWDGEGAHDEGVEQKSASDDESGLDHDRDGADHEAEHAGGEDEALRGSGSNNFGIVTSLTF